MILLVDKIEKSFGARVLFSGASFQINPGERFALVGPNGAGKTTMLKIIMGIDSPDAGQIQYAKDCQVGYLEQETNLEHKDTPILAEVMAAAKEIRRMGERANELQAQITELSEQGKDVDALLNEYGQVQDRFEHLGGYELESNARKILSGLGFKVTDFERPCSEFSGGWQMRIALAKLFLRHPDLLMLDEPTNHLDLESVKWLESFLSGYDGAVLLVSHDRAFMDACVDHVAALENRRVTTYTGNYSSYLKQREDNLEQMRAKRAAQERDIAHMQVFVDKFRYKPTKAVQVQSRLKQLEKIVPIEIDEVDNSAMHLKFPPCLRSGDYPVICDEVAKTYGDHNVFSGVTLTIKRGEKVAFVGKNGEGKSTLVKCIMGEIPFDGTLKIGHNVQIGYFAQNQAQLLDEDMTIYDTIDRVATGDMRLKINDLLGAFMFGGETSEKKVKVLSGGERSRLAMIRLLMEPVNLLILDEPTNHLDMQSKDVLKEAIRAFDGTAIIVSHDREFLDGLVTKVYEFGQGHVREHLGGIYDYLRAHNADSIHEALAAQPVVTQSKPVEQPQSQQKISYAEHKEQQKRIRKAQKSVEECERKIATMETRLKELDALLMQPENAADMELVTEYTTTHQALEQANEQWMELSEQLESLKNE